MHYHCEIIMPPVDDVEAAVAKIMAPYSENNEDSRHAFWDWYQLGGRYSGAKLEAMAPEGQIERFHEELKRLKVTVSGLQWGKQELSPASQAAAVDALWREMVPGAGDVCPLFKHSGDSMSMDVCRVDQIPQRLTAFTVIVANDKYDGLAADELLHKSIWNGASIQDTTFSGGVHEALAKHEEGLERATAEYREKCSVKPDWLCVTVDYHS